MFELKMGTRPVVCQENEGLSLYIYGKREQLMQKPNFSESLDATFTTAYKNVCDYKTPICSLRDASQVRGIGAWMLKQLKEFFSDGLEHPSSEDQSPKAKKSKTTRKYLPQKNSAPYALLITLHRGLCAGKTYMMKQELIDAAEISGLSRMRIEPSKGSSASGRFGDSSKDWYSGWTSMKTLVSKGLVVKSSCPAKYMLTEEGKSIAEECIVRGGLGENHNSSQIQMGVRDDSNASSDRKEMRSQNQKNGTASARNSTDDLPTDAISTKVQRFSKQRSPSTRTVHDQNTWTRSSPAYPPASHLSGESSGNNVGSCSNANQLAVPPLGVGERFSDIYKVVLVLDDREHFARSAKGVSSKPKFAERLREQYQVEVEIRHLPVGDAIWIACHKFQKREFVLDFILERKAVDDLWTSIKDTRYKQQKLRLLRCGINRLIYLIEGDANLTEAAETLKTAALTTEILEGFDVQRTRDVYDTISKYGEVTNAIFRRYSLETGSQSDSLARLCMSYEEFVEHCNEIEKERVKDVFGVQLMQVKHVTEDIALSILEKYPTLISLVQAYTALEGDTLKQENLLTELPIRNRNKSISSVISKNIYKFIWAP